MSKMGEEFNKRLEAHAQDLYEACKAIDDYLVAPYPSNMKLKKIAVEMLDKAIAKVEGKNAQSNTKK